ncbi:MAG: flagellar motor protein [Planctomycetes bacterium]|nr:flagellar motor protein [Planctomycetota bacterium]
MKLDVASLVGVVVAIASVLLGQVLEGGHVSSIAQPTAALIVLGGTFGACVMAFSVKDVLGAAKAAKLVVFEPSHDHEAEIQHLVGLAKKARKDGLIALESDAEEAEDPFLKKALWLAVDGTDPKQVQTTLETMIDVEEERAGRVAKIYESAGGFAPTVGILGAVLGLIHVMENLDDPSKLGGGIAVAFVATVYGVASANLLFLPMANKLKLRAKADVHHKELLMNGVLSIQTGDNVRLIEDKLRAALEGGGEKPEAPAAQPTPAAAAA